jgi:hypothetical protein
LTGESLISAVPDSSLDGNRLEEGETEYAGRFLIFSLVHGRHQVEGIYWGIRAREGKVFHSKVFQSKVLQSIDWC